MDGYKFRPVMGSLSYPIFHKRPTEESERFFFVSCYTLNMDTQLTDTSPEMDALQLKLLRQAGSARKLSLLAQINATVRTLALTGLRTRHPDDSPEVIRRRLADMILGDELAQKVYGPAPYET